MAHWLVWQITDKNMPKKCEAGAFVENELFGGRISFGRDVYFIRKGDDKKTRVYAMTDIIRANFIKLLIKRKRLCHVERDRIIKAGIDPSKFIVAIKHGPS